MKLVISDNKGGFLSLNLQRDDHLIIFAFANLKKIGISIRIQKKGLNEDTRAI